jgi:hypothetical protein
MPTLKRNAVQKAISISISISLPLRFSNRAKRLNQQPRWNGVLRGHFHFNESREAR